MSSHCKAWAANGSMVAGVSVKDGPLPECADCVALMCPSCQRGKAERRRLETGLNVGPYTADCARGC